MIFRFLFLLCLLPVSSFGQIRWENKNYKTISVANFRENPIFSQKLDKNLDYALLNATLFYLVNEHRLKNRKTALVYHPSLEITAWNHARQMGQFGFFSTENPKDAKRRKLENRGNLAGISNPTLSENLAYVVNVQEMTYLAICEKILLQWKSKKENLVVLLSDDCIQAGCGVFFFQNRWYAVQVFQSFEEINTKEAQDKLPD
jgi:uncharacterized protein YkwD